MRTLFKYLLPSIVTLLLLIFYFIFTDSGHKTTYNILSYYASHKSGLDVEVKSISLRQYPYVKAEVLVEKLYHVDIDGFVKDKNLDFHYKLNAHCFKSNICRFNDDIHIQGTLSGWRKNIKITGQGVALDGKISYSFRKVKHAFQDITLELDDVNASKLASILDQKPIFDGRAYATLHFDVIEKKHRIGTITYDIRDSDFYNMDVNFHAQVDVHDYQHTFSMNLASNNFMLELKDGTYNLNTKYGHANYILDVNDLNDFKKLLGGSYTGAFHAKGEMEYDKKKIIIKGLSHDLGGTLYFVYNKETLELMMENLSFETLMQRIHTKSILKANIIGVATYNIVKKEMKLKTKLRQTQILPSSVTEIIQKKFDFNLTKEIFDQSSFNLVYKDKHVDSSNFILANHNAFLKLTNSKMNAQHNAIDTYINLKTPKHALEGKLFARLDTTGDKNLDDLYLSYDGQIEKHYHLKVDGLLSDHFINMDYTLDAARLPSTICTIVDDINLSGHLSGSLKRLHIAGNGTAMEGKIDYSAIKIDKQLENVELSLEKIHALKLFTLLGLPDFPSGKINMNAKFVSLSETKKNGKLDFTLSKGLYKTLPITLNTHANLKENIMHFTAHSKLSTADINISNGVYDFDTNTSKAFYTLQTNNLLPLEPLIGEYHGTFNTTGKILYDHTLKIRGISPSFGGMVDFLYKKDMLYIDLEKVDLSALLNLFDYPHMIEAQLNGNINYDYSKAKLLAKTDLLNTRFLDSDLVQTVLEKSDVNMLKERFPKSTLQASYQNKILTGNLLMNSAQSHFYLTSARMDKRYNTVNAIFDLKMQGQAFSGKVYGDLKHPKVDLNMKKLLRYQMDKQMDSVMGKGNRKLMDAMPMGTTAKDMASEIGGGFLDMFF